VPDRPPLPPIPPDRPPRPPRAETREIVELRQLKATQPELAEAIDMQIALVDMQRRVQARVPLPRIAIDPAWARAQQAAGRPLVRFADIPLEWSDFRLTLRQTADILLRFEAIERGDHERILALGRDGNALEPLVSGWYAASSGVDGDADGRVKEIAGAAPGLDQVLVLAMRPFLARCAEALAPQVDLERWTHGHCPICGWEADFAVITPGADRRLFCGRCVAQWAFAPLTCPYCANDDRALITSFATRDGRYRVYACDVCRRYLKAYDARHATRPVMVAVDTIATLPLDAAAMQRGYTG
jgi:Protein involved in formate dehydrogenase formation